MSFSTRFVYVGVGGSGLKIGKALERLLREEVCGPDGRRLLTAGGTFATLKPYQLPDFIQTLYIDFSEQDLVSLQSDLLPRSPETAFKTATFVKSLASAGHSSADVTNLLRGSKTAQEVTDHWLPPKRSEWGSEPTFAPLSTGAGQYPTIGRAALFAFMERFGAEALLRDLRRPIERIVGSIGQLEEYTGATAASRNVVILVGCSLSGGTGGGLFLDVIRLLAHEASNQLGGTPFVVVPLILLPSSFDNVLAPSKRKNASLNAIRALADLGQVIDSQNAPTNEGEPRSYLYPGGSAGTGALKVVVPSASVKTAFLFHRPADVPNDGALSERVARFATNLVRQPSLSNLASGPLGSGRTMTLLDKLVNNSGLLQERHPTFVGRRPFASAACVAVPDAREQLVHVVARRLFATFLADARAGIDDDTRTKRMVAFQTAAQVQPPKTAPIAARYRTEILNPSSLESEDVAASMQAYQTAVRQVVAAPGQKRDGGIPDNLSAGAAEAFERAASMGDSGAQWVEIIRRTVANGDLDVVSALNAARETASKWAGGQLVGKEKLMGKAVVDFPSAQDLVNHERRLFGRSGEPTLDPAAVDRIKKAEESQVDAAWRAYLTNPKGTAVKFKAASLHLRTRLDATARNLDDWASAANSDTLIDEASNIVERFAVGVNVEQLLENVVRAIAMDMALSDATPNSIAKAVVLRHQETVLETWEKADLAEPSRLADRLVEAIREDVDRAFGQPGVYAGISEILRMWAEEEEGSLTADVRQFRTKMLASITDSVVPPANDREIEGVVAIAYPGEQNSRVEARLTETLATHPSLARFLQQAAPTFVPRSADSALIISVSLVGQGVMDVPDGAEGLNTWVESAFRPDPTDRLAWRQREGYRDPIDFIDHEARAELLQRMLAAAWNGELTAERMALEGQDRTAFGQLTLRFGAVDAPQLHISLDNMPFANHLAPLPDAYLREISQRYVSDTETVGEILRELSRSVPAGFVERRRPSPNELVAKLLFMELIPDLNPSGGGHAERAEFRKLRDDLHNERVLGQAKRIHQVEEYVAFWDEALPAALRLSFGTLGYGTFAEVIDELLADARHRVARTEPDDGTVVAAGMPNARRPD